MNFPNCDRNRSYGITKTPRDPLLVSTIVVVDLMSRFPSPIRLALTTASSKCEKVMARPGRDARRHARNRSRWTSPTRFRYVPYDPRENLQQNSALATQLPHLRKREKSPKDHLTKSLSMGTLQYVRERIATFSVLWELVSVLLSKSQRSVGRLLRPIPTSRKCSHVAVHPIRSARNTEALHSCSAQSGRNLSALDTGDEERSINP